MATYPYEVVNAPIEEINQVQTQFIWVIRNFEEKVRLLKDNITSPVFTTFVDQFNTNWQLVMTFDNEDEDDEDLSIFIRSLNNYQFRFTVKFSILNINKKEVHVCSTCENICEARLYGFVHFIKKRDLLIVNKPTLLNQGNLTIICTIPTNQYIDIENCPEDRLAQSLGLEESEHSLNFLDSKTFSDVVFSVEGKDIHANKSILANKSPVFQAMFTHGMAEARNKSVVVEDIPYSAMYDLLKCIYTGRMPVYSEQEQHANYLDLFIAANKYDIKSLKLACEINLSNDLKIDNVFETLVVADAHDASILKEKAIQFIASNADQIIESPAFKEFDKMKKKMTILPKSNDILYFLRGLMSLFQDILYLFLIYETTLLLLISIFLPM